MKTGCETYQQDLFGLIEGELSGADRLALEAHLQGCSECAAEVSHLRDVTKELEALGAEHAAHVALPESLVTAVLLKAEALREAEVVAFLDDALAPPEKLGVMKRLAERPVLREEMENAHTAHQHLLALGEQSVPAHLPRVDLVDGVMARVAAQNSVADFTEHRSLKQLEEELFALGDAHNAALPQVDLVAAVMAAASAQAAPTAKIVPLHARLKVEQPLRQSSAGRNRLWLAAAAAACIITALGLIFYGGAKEPIPNWRIAAELPDPGMVIAPPIVPPSLSNVEEITVVVPPGPRQSPVVKSRPRMSEFEQRRARYEGVKLQTVLNERRKAMMEDAVALAKMAEWSTLTEEEARAILEKLGWTTEAVLGAAQFLTAEEAAAVLQAAVASDPDDPYLRYALAKNLEELTRFDEGREQLAAWASLDPENSLALYMDADLLFQQGMTDDALARLAMAGNMSRASVYASESAQHHQQALISNGMNPDVASLIAASFAGTNEYADLVSLGEQLIQYGKEYEAVGDYTTAEQIYRAAQNMGVQLDQSAQYANVQLAGADVQMDAVGALMGLYQVLGSNQGQFLLEAAIGGIEQSLIQIGNIFTDYTNLFESLSSEELLAVTNSIIRQGDSSIYPSRFNPQY